MLGHNYRFAINQDSGVACTVVIKARRWKFDSTNALVWDSEAEVYNEAGIASSTTAWTAEATGLDNSSDKWLGAVLTAVVTPASTATANKSCRLEIQRSTDAGTSWPSGGRGELLFDARFAASASAFTVGAVVEF